MHKTKRRPDGALCPSPAHLGRGQPQRSAQGSAWSSGSPGSSSSRARGSCSLSLARGMAAGTMALHGPALRQGTSTRPAALNTPKGHSPSLGNAAIPARCRLPLPGYISRGSPACRHRQRATAEPDGLCQARTITRAPEAAAAAAHRAARGRAAGSQQDTSEAQPAAGSTSEANPARQGRHLQGKHTRRASRAAKQLPGALINKPISVYSAPRRSCRSGSTLQGWQQPKGLGAAGHPPVTTAWLQWQRCSAKLPGSQTSPALVIMMEHTWRITYGSEQHG